MNKRDFYINQYKLYHQNPETYHGESVDLDVKFITPLIQHFKAESLLDYGCGKGYQYTKRKIHDKFFSGIMPTLYDPGVPEYSKFPANRFDGVICCDVLEHVPEEFIDETLKQIFSKANKFVYISVSDIPAFAILPNGENAHVTQKPVDWWIDKIKPHTHWLHCGFSIRGNDRYVCQMIGSEVIFKENFW